MAARAATDNIAVTLRTVDGHRLDIRSGPKLDQAAMAWGYIARHRIRWQRNEAAQEDLADRCVDQLNDLGIGRESLDDIATSRLVEVSVPYEHEDENWASRVMPWEYVLSAAAGAVSNSNPLIVRHLDRRRRTQATRRRTRAAVVLGAIEALEGIYTFETERSLAQRTLGIEPTYIDDPTRERLESTIRALSPDVIHVGGMDVHQAQEYFDLSDVDVARDGMILGDAKHGAAVVPAIDLARIITAGKDHKPALVAFNLYNSGARIAALTVANGAEAAIGFQDRFDDLAAEFFLGEIYRAWQASDGDLLTAFYVAWQALSNLPGRISGSGVVLWSARSLVRTDMKTLVRRADAVRRRIDHRRSDIAPFRSSREAEDAINARVEPVERLNYALLHNRQPMFNHFELRNLAEERHLSGVRVEVELFAGTERLPYCTTVALDSAPVSVDDKIFIPLTSTLVRSLAESVLASLRVSVSIGAHQGVYEDSFRVTLLPTDEWVDDDENRQWLPSFVFPQDPAVEQILNAARPYLTFLADSPSAGFDGYQSFDPAAEDPAAAVDWQVEAIWSALVNSFSLGYINPPPTYTEKSQRLRFPSRILGEKEGTCIDLALLLAACLEYVNICPVVFLLEGHAFPGYWRSQESWDEFVNMREVEKMSLAELDELSAKSGTVDQKYPWVFPAAFHAEIKKQIEQGNLVPLETVWITTHAKFTEAQDTGWENVLKASEFQSLIDITMARECDVTPLPSGQGRV